tara:strand:- start:13932 stop:18674 length:4743 start_codon:yes stop_codon:yes gene_type:complete
MAKTTSAPTSSAAGDLTEQERGFAEVLKRRITGSFLPGEASLEGEALDEAAAFVLATARQREDGKPAIRMSSEAGERRFLRIAVVNKDVPFLVDSIAAAMAARSMPIDLLIHPILPVRRESGTLVDVPEGAGTGEKRESWIYIETARVDARERHALEEALEAAILDVRAAVADWPAMQARIHQDADLVADGEGAALLRWLGDGMMTQLGHLVRPRNGDIESTLGIFRRPGDPVVADETFAGAFAWFDGENGAPGRAPLVIKANRLSRVHRTVPLDLFIVPVYEDGRVASLSVHAGLWTSAALSSPPENVPVLRRQFATLMERLDFSPQSHDYKGLVHALTVLPHDLVISFADDDLVRVVAAMIALGERPRPRATLVTAPLGRHLFAFVWLPRDMLSTTVRHEIEGLLESETGARTLDWSLLVEGGNLALLRYVLDFRGQERQPDAEVLDRAVQTLLRGWLDAVEDALGETDQQAHAATLAMRYANALPTAYRARYGPAEAAQDIIRLRALDGNDAPERGVRLYCADEGCTGPLRLKIYQHAGSMPLSDAVPALENFGFRVLSEVPTELAVDNAGTIHDFSLGVQPGVDPASLLERSAIIEEAIGQVINGGAENDVFNRLVISAGLDARDTEWLRAFYRYLRQANIAFTIHTVVEALANAPAVTRGLIDLFTACHDPACGADRPAASTAAEEAIRAGLAEVSAINDDRVLRLYWNTIKAIQRTNVFAPAGREALAFKFDSSLVPGLPRPVPWREIFVYSRRVEGIHLRAGPVARGGLRWSDRRDDFRTEVLGLMKAQKTKNAVIVPTGAKGGFYPKQLPNPALDRDAWFAEGKESYKLFIRTLLSLTDNIVEGKVVHPDSVVIHDGEDPYFVVAADKGTATFSDTANAIAIEHDFWLGDAFASGGSNGYDHKAMGITARGAWVSVQRHFREMGVDVQEEPVRVIGVGDMSGDVFGNGMLLSKAIKVVAAFDHRHIFIDPDPDPAKSWDERKRLFDLPRSSWADYETSLISKGGGVFPRTTKRIELSPEAREALGISEEALDPESLVSAILKSPNDLLWFGGIGTYVKAADESNAEVGDPANDRLRVNAADLRVKVIGEGANLGVTQAGRIAFGLKGGRINTDFIDNSAGVDCSDNEVNIKIALSAARKAGGLSEERRNALLKDMTEDVSELVLEDNRLQALALSIAESGGARSMGAHVRLIEMLEDLDVLDRATEGLASDEELARRGSDGHGLTRPELAVLLSSTKMALQDAIEQSPLADDDDADALVLADFPALLQEKFPQQLLHHQLRREIVGTVVANQMVNRMGLIHPFELSEEEGVGLAIVGSAFVAASAMLDMEALWEEIDATAMPEAARLGLFEQSASGLRAHIADVIRAANGAPNPADLRARLGDVVSQLAEHADTLIGAAAAAHVREIADNLEALEAPPELARKVARLFALDGAIGIASLANSSAIEPLGLARAFTLTGASLGIDWAQGQASVMSPADPWERLLVAGLARDFQQIRRDFLARLAAITPDFAKDPEGAVRQWTEQNEAQIGQFRQTVARAQAVQPVRPAVLAQVAGQARNLLLDQDGPTPVAKS